MIVTLLTKPNANRSPLEIKVRPEDEQYLKDNNVEVEVEDIDPFMAMYATIPEGEVFYMGLLAKGSEASIAGFVLEVKRIKEMANEQRT